MAPIPYNYVRSTGLECYASCGSRPGPQAIMQRPIPSNLFSPYNHSMFKLKFKLSELAKRFIVSIIGVAGLLALYRAEMLHHLLSILFFVLYSEMLIVCHQAKIALWKKSAVFIIALLYMSLGLQAFADALSFGLALHIIFCVCIVDTVAYMAGRILQGPKLLPSVSPGKTWSGAIVAFLAGGCAFEFLIAPFVFVDHNWMRDFLAGLSFAAVVQIGDLLVSFAKRVCKVKDSSKLLPGMGGFWDRLDSQLAGAIFVIMLRIAMVPGSAFV